MFMITETTPRPALLDAIYGEPALIDHFMALDLDPELMETEALRDAVMSWIEAGDECAG